MTHLLLTIRRKAMLQVKVFKSNNRRSTSDNRYPSLPMSCQGGSKSRQVQSRWTKHQEVLCSLSRVKDLLQSIQRLKKPWRLQVYRLLCLPRISPVSGSKITTGTRARRCCVNIGTRWTMNTLSRKKTISSQKPWSKPLISRCRDLLLTQGQTYTDLWALERLSTQTDSSAIGSKLYNQGARLELSKPLNRWIQQIDPIELSNKLLHKVFREFKNRQKTLSDQCPEVKNSKQKSTIHSHPNRQKL